MVRYANETRASCWIRFDLITFEYIWIISLITSSTIYHLTTYQFIMGNVSKAANQTFHAEWNPTIQCNPM